MQLVGADERDLIRLRTNYRGEHVSLYRLNSSPEIARKMFLDYFKTINQLRTRPQWYNESTDNCTTRVHGRMSPCTKKVRWDWRILVHGYVDKPVAYEVDSFNQSLPFTELRARSLINELVKVADTNADFSERVRLGSPGVGQANNQIAAASRSHAITADDASQKFFNSHLAGQSVSFAP